MKFEVDILVPNALNSPYSNIENEDLGSSGGPSGVKVEVAVLGSPSLIGCCNSPYGLCGRKLKQHGRR